MHLAALSAIGLYILLLSLIGYASYKKHQTANDFILGSRKMNFWVTALAAHVSDMSSWIFMAYPMVIYTSGLINAWLAVGLVLFMFLNWQVVAPRLRKLTESYSSLTLPSFFESRFRDTSGVIRLLTIFITCVFYTIYVSAGLVGLGILLNTLFSIPHLWGMIIGVLIIVPYLFIGGYITLAWTDVFQGIFLVSVIVLVPFIALKKVGGFAALSQTLENTGSFMSLVPEMNGKTFLLIFFSLCSWGIGYFGQPAIITKFMGIKEPKDIPKSKWLGITWQTVSLGAATLIGVIGIAFFQTKGLRDPQLVFIDMVLELFSPFIGGFILCAILGATITCMSAQVLVLASTLTEDFYKKVLRKNAASKELLIVSRTWVFLVAITAFMIAISSKGTIYSIVSYAWFGLGSSFGPLILFALYGKKVTKNGALAGLIVGAVISLTWTLINSYLSFEIPTLIPGFFISSFTIWAVSSINQTINNCNNVDTFNE